MEQPIDNAPEDPRDYEIWAKGERIKALESKLKDLEGKHHKLSNYAQHNCGIRGIKKSNGTLGGCYCGLNELLEGK